MSFENETLIDILYVKQDKIIFFFARSPKSEVRSNFCLLSSDFCLNLIIFLSILLIVSYSPIPLFAQELCTINNTAFKRGERLQYRVHYMWMDAGTAILSVTQDEKVYYGKKTYHLVGTGTSEGMFDFFFKVRDKYESYIDEEALVPYDFIRRVDEGGVKIEQDVLFDQRYNKAVSRNGTYDVPSCIQDILSAFYYSRCLNYDTLKVGDETEITTFLDDEIYPMRVKYLGDEVLKTPLGTFSCQKFVPMIQKGRVFKAEEDMSVWLSKDGNHIPIRVQADLLVGAVKIDLTCYSGLVHPLAVVKN